MRVSPVRGGVKIVLFLVLVASVASAQSQCRVAKLEGEVRAGESFVRPIGNGLETRLEPLLSGWILRILPAGKPRPSLDYAELATPPYRSVSPLLVSTDYSFRAQDVVGWNPRRFRFAKDDASFRLLAKAYEGYAHKMPAPPVSQKGLAELVSQAPGGTFTILDAHLVPGTRDQVAAAAMVSTHFAMTAHTIESPGEGRGSTLGKVTWMRFRIAIEVPPGFSVDRRLPVSHQACSEVR
jgi:hypothetical protein